MARDFIKISQRTGETLIDGKAVGKRKWVGEAIADFSISKEIILNASSEEDFEEKAYEMMAGIARKQDLELGPVYILWSLPAEEYNGKG